MEDSNTDNNKLKEILYNSLQRPTLESNTGNLNSIHKSDLSKARKLVTDVISGCEWVNTFNNLEETSDYINNLSKLIQMLLKVIQIEREIIGLPPIGLENDSSNKIEEDDINIILNYAARISQNNKPQ